ncbi:MAG TPA: ABC transporter ATP-binding protein [Thermomicrobiales bacterium]|jgi:ABC-type branched-subunit amino acid transport system ATPase component|nr:ABC transporter ATP-binding protein [Thermomicrobiales bacterium]
MSAGSDVALDVSGLTVRFGGIVALSEVALSVQRGSRYGILGPNGSGKTTLFNAISGLNTPSAGRISLLGVEVTSLPARVRAHLGLARTFQITSLFPSLTVLENVAMATRMAEGVAGNWWSAAAGQTGANTDAAAMLDRLGIAHLAGRPVRSLGYGEQRQLEIAMALATRPSVLLLDEPTAGLSNTETAALTQLVRALPAELTILIIEHDLGVIFEVTDRLTVLQNGVVIASGPSTEIREDPIVKEVYLGR